MALRRLTRLLPPTRLFWREMRCALKPEWFVVWVLTLLLLLAFTGLLRELTASLWGQIHLPMFIDPGPQSLLAQIKLKLIHIALLLLSPATLGLALLANMQLTRRLAAHRSAHLQLTRLTGLQLFCAIAIPMITGVLCAVTLTEIIVVLLGWKADIRLGGGGTVPNQYSLAQVPMSWLDRHFAVWAPDAFTLELALVAVPVVILVRSFLLRNRSRVAAVFYTYLFMVLLAVALMALRLWAPLFLHTLRTPDDFPWPNIGYAPYFSLWGYIIAILVAIMLSFLAAPRFRRLLEEE